MFDKQLDRGPLFPQASAGPPAPGGQPTHSARLIQALEGINAATAESISAANSQVAKLMGGITKRSGSKSPSGPLMLSRFEELRVCMLTYCGGNSRISIAANAGANRFSVFHRLWDDGPRHPGPRGSGELGEDHHSQQFYLAG